MTTRNFRVNNGISVGDIVIDASTNKITGLSTSAPTADGDVANKKYVDDGLAGLSQNSITQGNSNVTVTDAGTGAVTIQADGSTYLTVAAAATTVANGLTASSSLGVTGNTTLSGNLSLTGSDKTVTLSPTGTGTVSIAPAGTVTLGTAGVTSTLAGNISAITSNQTVTLSPTGTGTVTIAPAGAVNISSTATGSINNVNIGASTPGTGKFSTLNTTSTAEFNGAVTINGNLTVTGTETILNTQTYEVADNLIGINSNVSQPEQMPRFSGIHIHRGSTSVPTEQDIYWIWDDAYNDDASTIFPAASGGTFTALRSTHNAGTATPNDDFQLVDIRCRVINATATSAQYADIAERFAADAPMTEGAVVMLGGAQEITETGEELSDQVFGVISSKPAYMMNAGAGNNQSHPFVAMTGRTPVRVTGVVNKGDRLVSSSVKGTARAAKTGESINPFHVIGRALESKSDTGIGMVNCFVQANN
jgi:hypothetical protein